MASRPHPHVAIPPGASTPLNTTSGARNDSWNFLVTPPDRDPLNLWPESHPYSSFIPPGTSPVSGQSIDTSFPVSDTSSRPPSRPSSTYESYYAFPEPQIYRSASQRSSLRPSPSQRTLGHRSTRSDLQLPISPSLSRGESRPPSFVGSSNESSPELLPKDLSDELSNLTLETDEDLRRFQAGELATNDEEWYRLVPTEARQVLDKTEVQRQSNIFEVIKAERDYVRDLELVQEVFIDPLVNTSPIPQQRLQAFVSEVFYNFNDILDQHQRMLVKLFARQQEQHPLVQSIADIVLDTCLQFREPYEFYIKHYPIAEARHRTELRKNPKYQYFLSQCAQDPRVAKRDLTTFLSRPVTRLPRLVLPLDSMLKHTAADHPDQDTLPLIKGVLQDLIKSTQPGIQAAESKVKFWELCESLVYQKGEIIDLDLYDESRTLLQGGTLARRYRAEVGSYNWADLHVALLDSYLLMLKPEPRHYGYPRNSVVSRPIPLEYLRLASFTAPSESRKVKSTSTDQTRLFDSFRPRYRQMYPFTIYHASSKDNRRYTLYASSEEEREKWKAALKDALAVRKIRQDANMWFAPHTVSEDFFKFANSPAYSSSTRFTGKILCATPITSSGKNLFAIGTPTGVYVGSRNQPHFRKVLQLQNVKFVYALQSYNRFIILSDSGLDSYSLDLLARVAISASPPQPLDASLERICGNDSVVLFAKVGRIGNRTMVFYATKSFLQNYLYALTAVHPSEVRSSSSSSSSSRRGDGGPPLYFRPFGEPISIPKDAHNITALHKNIGICIEHGVQIADPTNLATSIANPNIVPNFTGADRSPPLQMLKERCSNAKPLGLVKCGDSELLVVFDELGCYISKHGSPTRSSGYLRWESKATSYAHFKSHILLFSSEFIEIRTLITGRLVQVIEGDDIRLVHSSERGILVAMRGQQGRSGNGGGVSDRLIELVETNEIVVQQQVQASEVQGLWDEWDM